MTSPPSSSLRADVTNLAGKSLIYGLGSVLVRAVGLLVLPLYTRYLTPADYGLVALGSTLAALLSVLVPLGLYNAVSRLFFLAGTERDRRRLIGTIWLAMLAFGLVVTLALDLGGDSIFDWLFPELPFDPYVRIALWTAYLATFSFVPLNLLQAQERPRAYTAWTAATLLLTVSLTVLFVVVFGWGAYGYLLGTLVANAIVAIPFIVMTLRHADFCLDRGRLKTALAFSLPLIPHGLAAWVLTLSDRTILQIYVSVADLGLYSLGYVFGMVQIMISGAIGNAWFPFVFKRFAEQGAAAEQRVARLATYYVLTISTVAVVLCLFARGAIWLLTTEAFYPAHRVVPVIVLGYLCNGLYILPQNLLFLKSKTFLISVATVVAGAVNVAMNFWLVPAFGIMAAAWATFAAFFVMFVLLHGITRRVYPFPYEYKRIAGILAATAAVIVLGLSLPLAPPADMVVEAFVFLLFPLLLALGGFLHRDERAVLSRVARALGARLGLGSAAA
jgi:O-antigen/teichoic acid export membrane protein